MTSLEEKLKAKREAAIAAGRITPVAPPSVPSAPSAPRVTFMEPKANVEIGDIVDGLDIISAYNQFAGKGTVPPTSKTDGIKVRCPNPSHPDNNPSAWINTDKQVWTCGSCEMGGDKYDIAAWYFGMPVPGYKSGRLFHELRERIAASQGYSVTRAAGITIVEPRAEQPAPPPALVSKPEPTVTLPDGTVIDPTAPPAPPVLEPVVDIPRADDEDEVLEVELDWKPLAPAGTFLHKYMNQVVIDDVPEEYHFWHALLAVSSAVGRDATLEDLRPVYANLFICILGRTGVGKSKAKYLLDQLLHQALPYSATDPFSKGVFRAPALASAEALIWAFQKKIEDPSAPKGKPVYDIFPVRGIVEYSELSSLIARTQRQGSSLVPTLMEFYDMSATVSTMSRTHGTETAVEPFACALTTSQPKSLKGLLTMSDAASGFLNRWFFAMGKEKRRIPIGGAAPDIAPSVKPLQQIQAWATTVGSVPWSQDAKDAFTKLFYDSLEPNMRADDTDLLSRLDLLCKKLVLLFTANMMHAEVQVESVQQVEYMLPYLLKCYNVPGTQVGSTLQSEIRTEVLRVVAAHQEKKKIGPSARDISRALQRKKYPLDLFNKTLKGMVDAEDLHSESALPEGGKGRPTTRYTVDDLHAGTVVKITGTKEA